MALEATHIRFALDVKDDHRVLDLGKYLSGTVYPDSRYVSGIDRRLTHPEDFLNKAFIRNDDFLKGWAMHLLYDQIQYDVTKEKFPEIFEFETGQGSKRWIYHTALKILQDMDDITKFDIKSVLPLLDYVENPNGEDLEKVKLNNQAIQKMYSQVSNINLNSYYEFWKFFNIGEELSQAVTKQAEKFRKDQKSMELLLQIYPDTIKRYK